ncbi:MAG: hypothetical protein ABR985_09350 [Methanotrichaceae archaeon]
MAISALSETPLPQTLEMLSGLGQNAILGQHPGQILLEGAEPWGVEKYSRLFGFIVVDTSSSDR